MCAHSRSRALCTATANQLEMMSFQLERAFGEVFGLGFSQVNPGAFSSGDPNQPLGLPVMQPLNTPPVKFPDSMGKQVASVDVSVASQCDESLALT